MNFGLFVLPIHARVRRLLRGAEWLFSAVLTDGLEEVFLRDVSRAAAWMPRHQHLDVLTDDLFGNVLEYSLGLRLRSEPGSVGYSLHGYLASGEDSLGQYIQCRSGDNV